MRTLYLLALTPLLLSTAHAACVDEVTALARKYGIDTSLPKASEANPTTSDKLAASGGVIAPPPTNDDGAVKQADGIPDLMPAVPDPDAGMVTAPPILPQTADGETETHKATGEHAAAADSQAAAVLMAARQAGMNGQEATCEEGLAKAQTLLGK